MYRALGHLLNLSPFLSLSIMLLTIILILFHKKISSKNHIIYHMLCTIPLVLCVIHFFAFYLHDANDETIFMYGTMYMSSVYIFIWQFFYNKKMLYIIWLFPTLIVSIISFTQVYYRTILKENVHNLTYENYTKSFTKTLDILKREYALSEHKKIDYDYLYNKYYSNIEEAEKNNDEQLFYKTMYEFAYEFKDAHVNFYINNKDSYDSYDFINDYENRDYGFISVLLSDGTLSAIMVDEKSDAYKEGLRNGMTITKKDGISVEELIDDVIAPVEKYPVYEDERLVKSLWLFSTGNEKIKLTFIDETNKEKTIEVENFKEDHFYYRANEYYNKLFYEDYNQENLNTKMLNDTTGYLYVSHEVYDDFKGAIAYVTNDSSYLTNVLERKIKDLQNKGMEKLMIDLRGNSGGYNTESVAIASVFTNEEYLFTKNAKYKSKFYDKTYFKGTNDFTDLPITVLVDLNTLSAGDALVYALSKNPNVKVVGLTNPNNSCQGVGGYIYLNKGKSYITYPTYNFYYPDGTIFIDTDDSRKANITVDYKIPLTKESTIDIMNSKDDYILNYILENY